MIFVTLNSWIWLLAVEITRQAILGLFPFVNCLVIFVFRLHHIIVQVILVLQFQFFRRQLKLKLSYFFLLAFNFVIQGLLVTLHLILVELRLLFVLVQLSLKDLFPLFKLSFQLLLEVFLVADFSLLLSASLFELWIFSLNHFQCLLALF